MCVVEQESGLKVNQPASFAVSLNGAKGVIDAKVHSPSGALEECCVTEIDQGNTLDFSPDLTPSRSCGRLLFLTRFPFPALTGRQVRGPLHSQREWPLSDRCEVQWEPHPR